jgi:glutamate-1-semialdehyde 2,1-aminomutase
MRTRKREKGEDAKGPPTTMWMRAESDAMLARAQVVLAGGVNSQFRAGPNPPLFFERAEGVRLYDVDGNAYLDYALGQGPMLLGHTPAAVIATVQEALGRGQLYAGQFEEEILLAERLQRIVPCADLLRIGNSGSEAVQTALRLARGATGRVKYLKFEGHYHGWLDSTLISVAPPLEQAGERSAPHPVPGTRGQTASVLDEVLVLPWNDLHLLRQTVAARRDEIAAIITEPMMCNTSAIPPAPGFLEGMRELCDAHGIVLIFDEIITGFRLSLGGAQQKFGVTPDLAVFGKAMASGYPVACIAGKRALMDLVANATVMHAGTYNANVACVAASLATVAELEDRGPDLYTQIYARGERLMGGIRECFQRRGVRGLVQGFGCAFHVSFTDRDAITDYRTALSCDTARYWHLSRLLQEEGIHVIPRGLWYVSAAHTDNDVTETLAAFDRALARL